MQNRFKLLLLAFLAIAVTSCEEEFLETAPTDAIAASEAFASEESMQLVLNGVHRGLYSQSQTIFPGGDTGRANNHYWVPMGDNLTGILIHSSSANNLGWRTNAQWLDHTDPFALTNRIFWYHRYNIIAAANGIINNAPNLTETARLNSIVGQAYAYRAYAYLSLVQHFARGYNIGNPASDPGVILINDSQPPYESGPRSTVQETYDQIEADLDAAIAAFQNGAPRSGGGDALKSQLNINVAYGLKARMAMAMGDWQTAIDNAVLARDGFPLMSEEEWLSGFNTLNLPEVIWGSNVIGAETTFFRSYFYLASNTFNGSQIRNNPKIADRRMVDRIPETDFRAKVFLPLAPNTRSAAANGQGGFGNDPNYTDEDEFNRVRDSINAVYGITRAFNLHPYMHFKLKNKNPGSIDPDDVIYMRAAEFYLIEAEAKAMLNDIPGAQAALNALVQTRDSAFDASTLTTQEALMDEIKFQWHLEMWGEGFGYTNYIRWDQGIDHAADGGSGASEVLYQGAFQVDPPSVNNAWVFKIPQAEIDANPNLGPESQNQ